MAVEIRLLGRFAVRRDGDEVPAAAFGGRLARRLVRILGTRPGRFVPRDVLVELLWPKGLPADPDANLNVQINRARRALGGPLIETAPGAYALTAGDECVVDAEVFTSLVERGLVELEAGRPKEALVTLREALRRWGGDPLAEDRYEDWAADYRTRLVSLHQQALEATAGAAIAAGEPTSAVDAARQAVAAGPLHEAAHLALVRALHAVGDPVGALTVWEQMRERLREELGLDPSPRAQRLQAVILAGRQPARQEDGALNGGVRPSDGMQLAFVGRDAEVNEIMRSVGPPRFGTAVIAGSSGAGKSRLLESVAAGLSAPTLLARAFLPEQHEPWSVARRMLEEAVTLDASIAEGLPHPFAGALAQVAPVLGEVRPVDRVELASDAWRALALEAAARVLERAAAGGAVLLVDDAQWADDTSLELLGRAAHRASRLGLVVSFRPEEVGPDDPLGRFLGVAARSGLATRVSLGPLPVAALHELVGDPAVVAALVDGTDRYPFAVGEVIHELATEGVLRRGVDGRLHVTGADAGRRAALAAEAGQRRAVEWRLAHQPSGRRALLTTLALIGRQAPAGLVGAAVGRPAAEVLTALDGLADAGLVDHGDHGWAAAHDLIGEAMIAKLTPAQRAALHANIASALEGLADTDPAELARHLQGAGDPRAAIIYEQAARDRFAHHAAAEARELADAGLEVGAPADITARLLEVRAQARNHLGDLDGARDDLRAVLSEAPSGPRRALLLARLAMLESGAQDLVRASELGELALVEAGEDPDARARCLTVAAIIDLNLDRPDRSAARFGEALVRFEELGDSLGVAEVLDGRAMATFLGGDIRGGADGFDRAANRFEDTGDLVRVVTPRSTRGHARVFMGEPAAGLGDIDAALDAAQQVGHVEGEAYARWHRSEALSALERADEALAEANRALALARHLDHRGWTATSHRAVGIAREASDDLDGAAVAFGQSLKASEHLPLFSCWAASRLTIVLLRLDRFEEAAPLVRRALREGPELGRYEARLAHAELAAATGAADAQHIAAHARIAAQAGGHVVSAQRLAELALNP